jgi:hypothetical protein
LLREKVCFAPSFLALCISKSPAHLARICNSIYSTNFRKEIISGKSFRFENTSKKTNAESTSSQWLIVPKKKQMALAKGSFQGAEVGLRELQTFWVMSNPGKEQTNKSGERREPGANLWIAEDLLLSHVSK